MRSRIGRRLRALGLGGLLLPVLSAAALAQGLCPAIPPRDPLPREAVPSPLDEPYWRGRTAELSRLGPGDFGRAGIVFLGDSITQGWWPVIWEQFYAHRGALNLGVSGDSTQGMLWRLQGAGHWPATLRPRIAVLLIGTNNALAAQRPEDTALGVAEIVRLIHRRSPGTRILLVGLLPRGADTSDPARQANLQVNRLIAHCADNQAVFFTDPGTMLVDGQGRLSEQIAFDRLHLSGVGYAILAAGLEPSIRHLLSLPALRSLTSAP